MTLICVDPRTDARWLRLIERVESSIFHTPAWIKAVADTYGFEARAQLLLDESGEPVAGLPFCPISDLRGRRIVSFPFSDYYDPLVSDAQQWQALTRSLLDERTPIRLRCLHNEIPLQDAHFALVNKAKWHGKDLTHSVDELWRRLEGNCRRGIQRAERLGMSVQAVYDQESMRNFFEMHLAIRKYKYRLLAQPYHFFEQIWQQLVQPGHGALLTVLYQGQVISAALFLVWQRKVYYKFSASRREALALRPNDLLLWEGIKFAKARDADYLDLGLSDWDQEGLIAYKRKFATDEKTISFLEHRPVIQPAQFTLPPELLPTLTQLFTAETVADTVTEQAGELLYRYFV